MTVTVRTDLVIPEVLTDAIASKFRGMSFFYGTGALLLVTGAKFTDAQKEGGEAVKVPYFSSIGEFEDVTTENTALTVNKISMTSETSSVIHAGKAWSGTEWSALAAGYADIEGEAANQIMEGAKRRIERQAIVKARDVVTSTSLDDLSNTISYDAFVDGIAKFGDEEDGIVCIAMHSKVKQDVRKIKDSTNRPILVDPLDGGVARIMGKPVVVSDMCAQVFPTITEAGTTPPDITVTGEMIGYAPVTLGFDIPLGGARGTATFRYTLDGGTTWSTAALTAAAVVLGTTGLTANFAAGTYNVDNVYTGLARYETLLLKKGALVGWIQEDVTIQTDKDILADAKVLAAHLYFVVHPYSRLPGSTRSGVGRIRTK